MHQFDGLSGVTITDTDVSITGYTDSQADAIADAIADAMSD